MNKPTGRNSRLRKTDSFATTVLPEEFRPETSGPELLPEHVDNLLKG